MTKGKRVLIVCGTAIATSTMVAMKLEELLEKHGIKAEIRRCRTSEAQTAAQDVDLIVATTRVLGVEVPVVNGVPFITGVGVTKVEQEIVELLRDQ